MQDPKAFLALGVGRDDRPHLYFRDSAGKEEVKSYGFLVGKVQIRTREDALSYVRLCSSHKTRQGFASPCAEIVERSQLSLCYCLGDDIYFDQIVRFQNGEEGVFDGPGPVGWDTPEVKQAPGGYVVVRFVLTSPENGALGGLGKNTVVRRREFVSSRGEYRVLGSEKAGHQFQAFCHWYLDCEVADVVPKIRAGAGRALESLVRRAPSSYPGR
jgi:hypothetical protein